MSTNNFLSCNFLSGFMFYSTNFPDWFEKTWEMTWAHENTIRPVNSKKQLSLIRNKAVMICTNKTYRTRTFHARCWRAGEKVWRMMNNFWSYFAIPWNYIVPPHSLSLPVGAISCSIVSSRKASSDSCHTGWFWKSKFEIQTQILILRDTVSNYAKCNYHQRKIALCYAHVIINFLVFVRVAVRKSSSF